MIVTITSIKTLQNQELENLKNTYYLKNGKTKKSYCLASLSHALRGYTILNEKPIDKIDYDFTLEGFKIHTVEGLEGFILAKANEYIKQGYKSKTTVLNDFGIKFTINIY